MAQQQKTDAQIKYERKVKALELTIKSQGKPIMSKTLIDVAKKIEEHLSEK